MSSPVLRLQGKPISHELIATISRLLVGCNIPAVLWGDSLLSTYNVPVLVEVSVQGIFSMNRLVLTIATF